MKALLLSIALFTLTMAGVSGAHAAQLAQPSHAPMVKLTIKITDTGTLWGKVKATWKGGKASCHAATCHVKVPMDAKVTLTQTPTDTSTWPFKDWTIKQGSNTKQSKAPKLHVTVKKPVTVTAVYVLA